MSDLSIILVLASAVIHISWNSLTKSSSNPKMFSLIKGTFMLIMTTVLLLSIDLSAIPGIIWFYIVLSGTVHAFYIFSLSSAYETGDISYVYPIARSAPAFIPLLAFLILDESISIRGGIGIFMVILCILALQLRGNVKQELSQVLVFLKRKDSIWAFTTLACVITYSMLDKAAMLTFNQVHDLAANMHGISYFLLENTICYIIYWVYMLRKQPFADKVIWKKEWRKAILAAVATMLSYSLILHVMKTENLSYIVTLRQSSVLFAVIIGWLFFKEKQGRSRLIISVIMLFGLYLVAKG